MWDRTQQPGKVLGVAVPGSLPVLSRGRHERPERGACVMEYVSVLAGEPFSDTPRCSHAALATLARLVNDRIADDRVRSSLALLAPDLIAIDAHDPRVTGAVIASCLRAAARTGRLEPSLQRRLERAHEQAARPRDPSRESVWQRLREALWSPGAGVVAVFDVCDRRCTGPERDRMLHALLTDAVAAARALEGADSAACPVPTVAADGARA